MDFRSVVFGTIDSINASRGGKISIVLVVLSLRHDAAAPVLNATYFGILSGHCSLRQTKRSHDDPHNTSDRRAELHTLSAVHRYKLVK